MTKRPPEQHIAARDLPEIRAEMAAWLTDRSPTGGPATWARGLSGADAQQELRAAATLGKNLRTASLYYASADMAHLAQAAGEALPVYRLHPEDLPAANGLLVWEEPITEAHEGGEFTGAPIIAATWGVTEGGVDVRIWAAREPWVASQAAGSTRAGIRALTRAEVTALRLRYPQPIVAQSAVFMPFGQLPGWLVGMTGESGRYGLAEVGDVARAGKRLEAAERALLVSWLLMGQTLVREEEVSASKAAARRVARIDPGLLGAVRYVQLRHRSAVPGQRGGEGPVRSRQSRWIVSGHWRQQWYPSRQDHRPIWIDSHFKGPDGAPVLDPEKLVKVLRR